MRFSSTNRFVLLLVAVLLTVSLVSSLSIPNKKRNDAVGLVKRAAKEPVKVPAKAGTSRAAESTSRAPARTSSSRPAATSRPASSSAVASTSAAAAASSSAIPSSSAPASAAAASTSAGSSVSMSASMSTDASNTTQSPTTNDTAVPTGGMSTGAVAGIGVVCGAVVLGAGVFAMVRYKRKASLTQNLGNKSVNQFSSPSPYPATSSPFPAGNTGYERLSDPSLSGASVPSGVPQAAGQTQGLGTFTVISTYTPTLGDELEIQPGDKVTILVEYDDGWCQGVNESRGRVKGVFPKHCVDYGNQGGMDEAGRGKRVSSMYGSGGYRM